MSTASTSPCAIYPALEQSFERYPERWYENTRLLLLVTAVLTAILIFLQSQLSIPVSPGAWASGLAVAGWMAVWFADVYSTGRIGEMKIEFDRRGLEPFGEEQNPLLPAYPTWGDLIVNWTNVGSLALSVFFWLAPLLAMVSIVFRGGIVLANVRTLRRLKLALVWIDREAAGGVDSSREMKNVPVLRLARFGAGMAQLRAFRLHVAHSRDSDGSGDT